MRRSILLTVISLSLVGVAGCGRSDDSPKVTTRSDGTQVVTVTDGKGTQVTVAGAGSSANMPAYAPLFPGATVESTVTTPNQGGMVAFKTTATPQDVIDFYKKSATAAGFEDNLSMTSGNTMTYGASHKQPEHALSVVAVKNEDGTQVQVTWN